MTETIGTRIKRHREQRKLSQEDLAEILGVTRQTVYNWERDKVAVTWPRLNEIALALGVRREDLAYDDDERERADALLESVFKEDPAPYNGLPSGAEHVTYGRRDFPIYASSSAGDGGQLIDYENVVEYRHRPPELIGVKDAWGMYVIGDSMEPRYEQGNLVHVNPNKPARRGHYVVIVKTDNTAYVKQLVSPGGESGKPYVLHQLNPERDIEVPADQVQGCYRIVGATTDD